MRHAIEERISRRTFTTEPLSPTFISNIQSMLDQLNQESGLSFQFEEDGSEAFASARKTYGMFKNVRSMILLKGDETTNDFKERIGYYGEKLGLDLVDLGLGTCWVGGTFDRDTFALEEGEALPAVLLVGQIGKVTLKDRVMIKNAHEKRKPLSARIDSDTDLPDWVLQGMESVIPAPSAVNKQKPHFNYKNGVLSAKVPDDYVADLIDLGIAKFHFEQGAGGHFDFGNGGIYHR